MAIELHAHEMHEVRREPLTPTDIRYRVELRCDDCGEYGQEIGRPTDLVAVIEWRVAEHRKSGPAREWTRAMYGNRNPLRITSDNPVRGELVVHRPSATAGVFLCGALERTRWSFKIGPYENRCQQCEYFNHPIIERVHIQETQYGLWFGAPVDVESYTIPARQ